MHPPPVKRAIFYIDGFNLYFGLKSQGWRKYYWLNLEHLCKNILRSFNDHEMVIVKYFTARVSEPEDKRRRQQAYLEALETLDGLEIIEGIYHIHPAEPCGRCQKPFTCDCGHPFKKPEEKRTDVNIAVHLLCDAFNDLYDTAFLISGDSDLVPAVEKVKLYFGSKKILVFSPPNRVSRDLCRISNNGKVYHIFEDHFKNSQFPDDVKKDSGFFLKRPPHWR